MSYARWIIEIAGIKISTTVTTSWLIIGFLAIVSYFLTRNLKKVPTSKVQLLLEFVVKLLDNMVKETMGTHAVKKLPFIVILLSMWCDY